jgi:translation initiation factor 1A
MRLVIVCTVSSRQAYLISNSPPTVKAYGELPENAKINETDTFGEEDGECTFEFGDDGEVDIDDI